MSYQSVAPISHQTLSASSRHAREVARMIQEYGDLSPAYQRGSVWTNEQRMGLVRSWLAGVPIPAVVINDRFGHAWPNDSEGMPVGGYGYGVIDGKQRIETATAWFNDDFAVPASWFPADSVEARETTPDGAYVRWSGLTLVAQRLFGNRAMLPVIEARVASVGEEADLYLLLNGGGTPQTGADMANAAATSTGGRA